MSAIARVYPFSACPARPRYDVQAIKRAVTDPRALCGALGRAGVRERRGVKTYCPSPSHRDSTPSCSVFATKDRQVGVRCFGCDFKGSAIDFVMAVLGVDFVGACEWIDHTFMSGDAAHVSPVPARVPVSTALDATTYASVADRLLALSPLEVESEIASYAERRGVLEEAQRAGIGAMPHAILSRDLRDSLVASFGVEALIRADICDKRGGFVFANHRLLLPWRDRDGRVSCVQRRHVIGDSKPKYVFPSGMAPREPFGSETFDADLTRFGAVEPTIIVTEGVLDCLAARTIARREGLPWVVLAAPSAESGSRIDWAIVRGHRVFVVFDGDAAGERGRRALARVIAPFARVVATGQPNRSGGDWCDELAKRYS